MDKKNVFTHNAVYSAIKKGKLESFEGKWMHLETITFSEINHTHKFKYCIVLLL